MTAQVAAICDMVCTIVLVFVWNTGLYHMDIDLGYWWLVLNTEMISFGTAADIAMGSILVVAAAVLDDAEG
jgi:hypothetical protein